MVGQNHRGGVIHLPLGHLEGACTPIDCALIVVRALRCFMSLD